MNRHLHIICLDVPWPPDYGGAIDMFYRLEALYNAGIKIHLHYFSYNERGNPNELNKYCEYVHDYERKKGTKGFSLGLPYIVASRINQELAKNLSKDQYPILIEGIHCTGILRHFDLSNRKIVVRLHNDEHAYYSQLAKHERNLFKKFYFQNESLLLKKYQHSLPPWCHYACITEKDERIFKEEFNLKNVFHLPAFTPFQEVKIEEGSGSFCLYHGNLAVSENKKAAQWLLEKIFRTLKIPLVIAGRSPSRQLHKMGHCFPHIHFVSDPSTEKLNDLVRKAHINILPSFNDAGIKIKLLHALFEGRHCLVNPAMIEGTGLESACHVANNPEEFTPFISDLFSKPFTASEINKRNEILGNRFNNKKNVECLIPYL